MGWKLKGVKGELWDNRDQQRVLVYDGSDGSDGSDGNDGNDVF